MIYSLCSMRRVLVFVFLNRNGSDELQFPSLSAFLYWRRRRWADTVLSSGGETPNCYWSSKGVTTPDIVLIQLSSSVDCRKSNERVYIIFLTGAKDLLYYYFCYICLVNSHSFLSMYTTYYSRYATIFCFMYQSLVFGQQSCGKFQGL